MENLNNILKVAKNAALSAQEVVMEFVKNGFRIDEKGPSNLVTEADIASEKTIVRIIKESFPDHLFLGEETEKSDIKSPFLWVIDPIDGTTNFAHGVPYCGISIGFFKDGEPLVGVVLNPFTNELFQATKGGGAFLNDNPIQVSSAEELKESLIVTGFNYEFNPLISHGLKAVENLIRENCHGIRRMGAASLDMCYVASGRFDGYYELRLMPWDFGAGMLIVREAGGKVIDLEGKDITLASSQIICTNQRISEKLCDLVNSSK